MIVTLMVPVSSATMSSMRSLDPIQSDTASIASVTSMTVFFFGRITFMIFLYPSCIALSRPPTGEFSLSCGRYIQ